ncbi:hypothetical protein EUX98_g7802 [Antrodiella citrinella]|uniref:ribonuclease H n=1 Tax=Antrodiella citrinella TaxID=2447956 RepID=A0A4S4MMB0_9APHY|nr:hypothetical protein EUX98_g7802 [Antrodiella citrinella]
MSKAGGTNYYAVARGWTAGVYTTWEECEAQVKGFAGAKYKKFHSAEEAEDWKAQSDGGVSAAKTMDARSAAKPYPDAHASTSKGKGPADAAEHAGKDVVYSDGACKGNGRVGSVAGTNNRAELIAIIHSQYSIKCVREWLPKWRRDNFRTSKGTPVANQPIIKYLDALIGERKQYGQSVDLGYVKGHVGIEGNEGADAQANLGCELPEVEDPDWEAKGLAVQRRITDSGAVSALPHTPVASTSTNAVMPDPVKHGAILAAPAEVSPGAGKKTRKDRIADAIEESMNAPVRATASAAPIMSSSATSRFKPSSTPVAGASKSTSAAASSSIRQQRLEQVIEESLRSPPPPDRRPPGPVTPTKTPTARAGPGEAITSRLAAFTPTRPSRAAAVNAAALTPDGGVFATAAARAAFTDPRRTPNERNREAGPSTTPIVASLRRGRPQEPTYKDIGIEAKLCDCCRDGMHRRNSRSASPPPRRTTRERESQESAAKAPSITESDLNAYAAGLVPDDELLNDLSF